MTTSKNTPGAWYKRLSAFLWYDCIYLVHIGMVCIIKEISSRPPILDVTKIDKRTGQVVVITGGPRGLALGLIKRLVLLDYTIIMGVRSISDSQKRLEEFAEQNKDYKFTNIKFLGMDLMSLKSIREFAYKILEDFSRVDLLLCNAAIIKAPYEITVDGYESMFQVNYLSNFLLTELLLERMKATAILKCGPCQIIYTSSVVYQYGKFNINELEKPIVYTPYKFYSPSKLYPVMSMLHLQKKLDDENSQVYCYAVHPGLIPTDMWYDAGGYLVGMFERFARSIFRSAENAADTILWPAFSEKYIDQGGLYMESGSSVKIANHARNPEMQYDLYEISLKLAGL